METYEAKIRAESGEVVSIQVQASSRLKAYEMIHLILADRASIFSMSVVACAVS